MKAIRVTIYATKSKSIRGEITLRGYVVRAGSNWIDVKLGKSHYHFVLAKAAKVEYRRKPVTPLNRQGEPTSRRPVLQVGDSFASDDCPFPGHPRSQTSGPHHLRNRLQSAGERIRNGYG